MKVIEQLVKYLRDTELLSEGDVTQLRDEGFLPSLREKWGDGDEDDYDYYESGRESFYAEEELAAENELLRRLTVRDRQRRSAGNKSRRKKSANDLRKQVSESVRTWLEEHGQRKLQQSFDMSGNWRNNCVQISTAPDTELRALLLSRPFSKLQEWLLYDPVWAVMDSRPFAGLDKSGKRVCHKNAVRLLSAWHRAQTRVCRTLADIALISPGLFDMIGWWENSVRGRIDSTFVWLLLAGKLLKSRMTSSAVLSTMTLPEDSLLTLNRYFWLNDESLSREELWMLSLAVKALHLSEELVQELVGYPEIHFRWEEIPSEIHGRLRRFLSEHAWWML